MSLSFVVEVQDYEGKEHYKFPVELSAEATIKQLMDEITEKRAVKFGDQELYFEGSRLLHLEATLTELGIQNRVVIVLKHGLASRWQNYELKVQDFRDAERSWRRERAMEAHEESERLKKAGFFSTYPKFEVEYIKMRKEYATLIDNTPEIIKEVAKKFFTDKFKDKTIEIEFQKKPSGSRAGAKCIITFDEMQCIYYIKTNHNASSNSATRSLDMVEIFLYKFLEVINVGAKVDYISNTEVSERILYICGEEVPKFNTLQMFQEDWEKFERKYFKDRQKFAKSLVQISFLSQILGLGDLNSQNIGFNEETLAPYIVDFWHDSIDFEVAFEGFNSRKRGQSSVSKLQKNIDRFSALVKDLTLEDELKIAKECIEQWEIVAKLDEAKEQLNNQKEQEVFKRADLKFKQKTQEVDSYIKDVVEKVNRILDMK